MKKGEIYEGIIESVDFPNKGRVPVGDTVVTVKNGIQLRDRRNFGCLYFNQSMAMFVL